MKVSSSGSEGLSNLSTFKGVLLACGKKVRKRSVRVTSFRRGKYNSGEYKQPPPCQASTGQTGNTALLYHRHQVPSISATQKATGRVTSEIKGAEKEEEKQEAEKRPKRAGLK